MSTLFHSTRNFARTTRRLRNNPEFFQALKKIAFDKDRENGLFELWAWSQKKILQTQVNDGLQSAKGFAERLLQASSWTDARLDTVSHFGCLAPLMLVPATRHDYVALQIRELLRFKRRRPQLGLGAPTKICFGNRSLTRLELAQTWAIALNFGHLFGTFGTERALLYHLHESQPEKYRFLNGIDSSLRGYCENIVNQDQLHRFFYVLAGWRISQLPGNATRKTLIECLQCFFETKASTPYEPALWAFNRSRQLAYHRLHALVGLGSAIQFQSSEDVIDDIASGDGVVFHEYSEEDNPLLKLLDAFDEFHLRSFFTSSHAAALVLAHIREFREWWRRCIQDEVALEERINLLFAQPSVWPQRNPLALSLFARMDLPGKSSDWRTEVRAWLNDREAWDKWHFLISSLPGKSGLICDVYRDASWSPRACYQIADRLTEHSTSSWTSQDEPVKRKLWRSIAHLGTRLLQEGLREGVSVVLEPTATELSPGYAMLSPDKHRLCDHLQKFIAGVEKEQRRKEIQAVSDAISSLSDVCESQDVRWLVFLATVYIVDDKSGDRLKEIDGLWAAICPEQIKWYALEHKMKAQGAGKGQLAQLGHHLKSQFSAPEMVPVSEGKASYAFFYWPPKPV